MNKCISFLTLAICLLTIPAFGMDGPSSSDITGGDITIDDIDATDLITTH